MLFSRTQTKKKLKPVRFDFNTTFRCNLRKTWMWRSAAEKLFPFLYLSMGKSCFYKTGGFYQNLATGLWNNQLSKHIWLVFGGLKDNPKPVIFRVKFYIDFNVKLQPKNDGLKINIKISKQLSNSHIWLVVQ